MKKYSWIIISIIAIIEIAVGSLILYKMANLNTDYSLTQQAPTPTTLLPPTVQPTVYKNVRYPSQVFDLSNWKITLPVGASESPTEVKQPTLATYQIDPWFVTAENGTAIRFRAAVNGVTTSGSGYPRSELREMTGNGAQKANWSSVQGAHEMFLDEAITSVPMVKKHVVAGQIHDADDDIIVIRLEYPNLYVNANGKNVFLLDKHYALGKRFQITFVVENAKTKVYYNGSKSSVYTLDKVYSGAYFKAGAYTQSNCDREGKPPFCNTNNFGEVLIYQARITHK